MITTPQIYSVTVVGDQVVGVKHMRVNQTTTPIETFKLFCQYAIQRAQHTRTCITLQPKQPQQTKNNMNKEDVCLLLTQILQMNANLMHTASEWLAKNHAGFAIETKLLKNSGAILAFRRHFAYTNFIANHFDWFLAFDRAAVNMCESGRKWMVEKYIKRWMVIDYFFHKQFKMRKERKQGMRSYIADKMDACFDEIFILICWYFEHKFVYFHNKNENFSKDIFITQTQNWNIRNGDVGAAGGLCAANWFWKSAMVVAHRKEMRIARNFENSLIVHTVIASASASHRMLVVHICSQLFWIHITDDFFPSLLFSFKQAAWLCFSWVSNFFVARFCFTNHTFNVPLPRAWEIILYKSGDQQAKSNLWQDGPRRGLGASFRNLGYGHSFAGGSVLLSCIAAWHFIHLYLSSSASGFFCSSLLRCTKMLYVIFFFLTFLRITFRILIASTQSI